MNIITGVHSVQPGRHKKRIKQARMVRWPVYGTRLCAVLCSLVAVPLSAQTLFQWPSTPIDVLTYRSPAQCVSFLARLDDSLVNAELIDKDTLPLTLAEVRSSPDSTFINAARRCSVKYHPDEVARHNLTPVLQLYLTAGRDADAQALAAHILAIPASGENATRVAVLADIIRGFLAAKPARLSAAIPFIDIVAQESANDDLLPKRLGLLNRFMVEARRGRDTALMQGAARKLLELADRWPGAIGGARSIERRYVLDALEALASDSLLDSLRTNTAAYVAMHRALQKRSGSTRAIGERAPALLGDYWFVKQAGEARSIMNAPAVRPAPGKVSLVVFLEPWALPTMLVPNYNVVAGGVRSSISAARRLSEQYPDLDVTAVTETHGVFDRMEPPKPDAEADTLRRFWMDFWHFPGTLVIERSPFSQLPDPDRRVIEQNPPNIENYNFGVLHGASRMWTFIVDRDGTIVWYGKMDRESEEEMARIIGILIRRNSGGA